MAAPGAPAPELIEVLLGEIIHRLPPDDPACLFRASVVSRAWRAFVTNDDVIRRYREFHEAPPVLGLLQNIDGNLVGQPDYRFFATAFPSPPTNFDMLGQGLHKLVLDCRHGRVLVHTVDPLGLLALFVFNPITGERQDLPYPPVLEFTCFAGAVTCAVNGCDHLDCHGGAFRVVFTGTFNTNVADDEADNGEISFTWACLYSSETGDWTPPTQVLPGPLMVDTNEVMGPSLLAGDTAFFTLDLQNNRTVLRYDLDGASLSVMNAPLATRDTILVTGEHGGLGVAAMEGYRLRLWSWSEGVWEPWRDIILETMIPFTIGIPAPVLIDVIGFAEMAGVIFVRANGIISSVDLNSGEVREVPGTLISNDSTVFPFESFYTPV